MTIKLTITNGAMDKNEDITSPWVIEDQVRRNAGISSLLP
jgi:hypothetical protein